MKENINEKRPFFVDMSYGRQCFLLFAVMILLTILASTIFGVIAIRFECSENIYFMRLMQFVNTVLIFLLPALLFSKWMNGNFWSYSHADVVPKSQTFPIVVGLTICIFPLVVILGYLNELIQLPHFLQEVELWMKTMEERARNILLLMTETKTIFVLLLNLLLMAVTPAVCEEFFFRGAMQPLLQKWTKNKHIAIWITAFIFSAIHLQFYGFIARFLLGAYLGYLMIWSRSIWLPVFAHFLHNGIMITLDFFIEKSENAEVLEQITPETVRLLLPWVVLALVGLFFGLQKVLRNIK